MFEQRATRLALERLTGRRAFSLSRSTFMGSGGWGAHWLGDNNSDWGELVQSIAEVLSMGLYGVVMIGASAALRATPPLNSAPVGPNSVPSTPSSAITPA